MPLAANERFGIEEWECAKCGDHFVDPDDYPEAKNDRKFKRVEPKEYWLGPTEPVCSTCARQSGIPSIDTR